MKKPKFSTAEERHAYQREVGYKLVAWRAAHPITEDERARRRKLMLDRWANKTPAERAEHAEKSRVKALKQMADPKAREHLSKVVAEQHAREGYRARFKMTPEIRAKIGAAQQGKRREWTKDPEKREAASLKLTKKKIERFSNLGHENHELFRPEVRARAEQNSREEVKTNPRRGKFETNIHAMDWHLRDMDGRVHHFRNLQHFIRNHRWLFTERQLQINAKGHTRIYSLLASLSPRKKHPTTCSQGWTWVLTPGEADPRGV